MGAAAAKEARREVARMVVFIVVNFGCDVLLFGMMK